MQSWMLPFADFSELGESLLTLLQALWDVFISLLSVVTPWTPLLAWIVFWLFAVNWVKLRQSMLEGAWIGVVLIGVLMVLVWGTVSPADGHELLGLSVSNYVGKFVYVTLLFCIMFLCGAVQLSGALPACCSFDEAAEEPAEEEHGHGH